MKNQKLAHRYAKALYEFSLEENQLEEVYKSVLLLKKVFHDNRNLHVVMESPVIEPDKKSQIFLELFDQKVAEIALRFLTLIIKKKREPELHDMFNEFIKLYYQYHNIKVAQLTTAVPIDDVLAGKIKTILEEQTKSTIELKQLVNSNIIGGFVVRIEDYRLDASILGKINKLKMEFLHNVYQAGF